MVELLVSNPVARYVTLTVLFVLVVGIAVSILSVVSRRAAVRSELRAISGTRQAVAGTASLQHRRDTAWTRIVERIEQTGLNLNDTKSDQLRDKLVAAGFDSPAAPRLYTLIRLVLVIAAPTLFVVLSVASGKEVSFLRLYIVGSICALAGLYLPALFITAKADRRREAIVNGFPDSLDLMLVCVEAGLGLEAALDRVGREMVLSQPLVSALLTTATLQLRAGASREVALRRMAETARVDEINSFVTLLVQSDKLGTSIASTLRVYAAEMRERRRMRAEEKAHRIPVLISVPLVTCMLPVMIGVLMLPAAIRVVRQIAPAMAGG